MTAKAYITDIAGFLPNAPVDNDTIESVLGMVAGRPSRSRTIVLRNNGIKTRHYAIDPATGRYTHTNAQMAAAAVRALAKKADFDLNTLECLCTGTSGPDLVQPSHGHMVHGELGTPPCEVHTAAAVCTSSMSALRYAMLNVRSGEHRHAICTGSELSSRYMRGRNFEPEMEHLVAELEKRPEIAFEKDFLRWMLSDGAGALLIEPAPRPGLNLRVEWIDIFSYAHLLPACMYVGAEKQADGALRGWMLYSAREREANSIFALKQDVRLLNDEVIEHTLVKPLARVAAQRALSPGDVDWFLPHYSSEYFRAPVADGLARAGLPIPQERWFTNLERVGNVGSASIYIMLDELLKSGRLRDGQHLLCWVPESGRFSSGFIYLTATAHA